MQTGAVLPTHWDTSWPHLPGVAAIAGGGSAELEASTAHQSQTHMHWRWREASAADWLPVFEIINGRGHAQLPLIISLYSK